MREESESGRDLVGPTGQSVDTGSATLRTWGPLVTLWIIWGTTFLGTSAMVQTMPPLLAAGARYLFGGVLLALVMVAERGTSCLRIPKGELRSTAIAGIGIMGIWGAILGLALQHIPGGIAALIGATVPLWIILLRVVSGQRINWHTSLGVAIGLLGVAAMLLPGGIAPVGGSSPGQIIFWSVAMLVASMTYAVFSWRSRSLDLPPDTLVSTVYQLLWAGAGIVAAGLVIGERPLATPYSATSWAGLAWLIFASVVGYAAYTFLVQNVPMSLVSTFA